MAVNHDMFEGRPFRGSLTHLTVHATALMINRGLAQRRRAHHD